MRTIFSMVIYDHLVNGIVKIHKLGNLTRTRVSGVASGRTGGADCPASRVSVQKKLGRSKFLVVTFFSVISKQFQNISYIS